VQTQVATKVDGQQRKCTFCCYDSCHGDLFAR
jgi:hypothetical protein